MSQAARPLRILAVSPETTLLHDLSWMLSAVGYTVETSKDVGETAAWRQFSEADFVLFDGRTIADPTASTLALRWDDPIYRIVLYNPSAATDYTAWFAAGASDGLRIPLNRGELLARLRVGARVLEFENRMRRQSSRSQLPGVYSVRGLLQKLKQSTTGKNSAGSGQTFLTTAIDFFAGARRERGESAMRGLLEALATAIERSVSNDAIVAYADQGTFLTVLPGRTVPAARAVAEQIAQHFRAAQVDCEPRAPFSVATAIVPWRTGMPAEQVLEQGRETLAIAGQSGGDCIVEHDEFAQELSILQNELTAGNPFANVTAQDLMEPFPAVVERDSANPAMLAALRRARAPVWPLVDREGRLVGVAPEEITTDDATAPARDAGASPAPSTTVTIAHDATFSEIYEAFSTQGCLTIVVVTGRRPIGYIGFDGFLSLLKPIDSSTFAARALDADELEPNDSRCLLVGSPVSQFEPMSAADQ